MAELRKAARDGDVAGATTLLDNGANVNAADQQGEDVRRFPFRFPFLLLSSPLSVGGWGVVAVTGLAMDPELTLDHHPGTGVPVRMQEEGKEK